MSFFDFFGDQPAAPAAVANDDITIYIGGGDRITIPYANAQGKTIAQLFSEKADELGADARRITRFLAAGSVVPATQVVSPGATYQGSANIDEKG